MDKYYVRGKAENEITNLYKVAGKDSIQMYYGNGIWESDFAGSGNTMADIFGFGGSWYNIDEIDSGEVGKVVEGLEVRYKRLKLFGYRTVYKVDEKP